MELRLLRTFATVARTGNVSAAASELATSQPAVTKQLQLLERRVGATLFVRGRQGARLTTAGEALLPDALDLLARADAFERRAVSVAAGADGTLAVGFGLSGIQVAPQAVALFRRRHPGVEVSLEDMSSAVQCERLLAGTLQVGFVRLPAPEGISVRRLRQDRLALAVPAKSTAKPPSTAAEFGAWLDERPIVSLRSARGPGLVTQINRLYDELRCRPQVLQEADDLQTVLALVAAGVGAAVVPVSAAAISPQAVDLIPIPGKAASWWIGVAWVERSVLLERFVAAAVAAARP
ncbi:LysR substrate-binding domain-containing protein [Kribbella sp. NPDC051770]|uniref:LysR substrate-binding domain-containing protein n=1 Tax=Kribbella sp. NPDC051770 TaxID=3155413 RepID=UPI003438C493